MQTPNDDGAKTPLVFPVLPLRDIVVFPHKIVPLFVGREKSVRALEDVGLSRRAGFVGTGEEAVGLQVDADSKDTERLVAGRRQQ